MTGAMYAAVSGLRAHMNALNVIGNNIANINTNAYKASRYVFAEELYTNVKAGSDGSPTKGGTNPAQIGYGVNVGQIDIDMSTKNYTPTGRPFDVTIDGDGFLLVGNKDLGPFNNMSEAKALYLTRLGNLDWKDGYLVDGEGNCVYGWNEVGLGEDGTAPDGVTVDPDQNTFTSRVLAPVQVPYMTHTGELLWPSVKTEGAEGTSAVIDFERDANGNVTYEGVEDAPEGFPKRAVLDSMTIDENGQITGTIKASGQVVVLGYVAVGQVDSPNGVTHVDGHYYQALPGAGNLHIATMGKMLTPNAAMSDEQRDNIAAISDGLDIEDAGDTYFVPNGLESSGTELATEISNMIMMQRGYQANTRIITVTDSMLEELVNMKR